MLNMVTKFLLAIALIIITSYICAKEAEPLQEKVPQSLIHIVKVDNNANLTVLAGSVIPWKMVNLSAQLPGSVEFIAGQEGDFFTQGTALVSLNTASLRAKREQAVAQYNSASAGVGNAIVQYKREALSPNSQANSMLAGAPSMLTLFSDPMRSLSGQGNPDFERHSNMYGQGVQVETARNQVMQAQAAIKELDENLKNAISIAPFDGMIVKKMIEVGDIIQPGMPLLVFADTSQMQVQVEVPTKLINLIKEGDTVSVRLESQTKLVSAKIARIFPMANMGGHTTTVKVNLTDSSLAKAGMYAEVLIPNTSSKKLLRPSIPKSSISWRGSLPAVFLVVDNGSRLKMKTLRLGKSDGSQVSVLSGLKVGEKIFLSPQVTTRSGPYHGNKQNHNDRL